MDIKKFLKTIKLFIIVFIISSLIISLFISQYEQHLTTCHDERCFYCLIIYIAQNIINLAATFIIYVILVILIHYLFLRLHKDKIIFLKSSLVFQKVQLNE